MNPAHFPSSKNIVAKVLASPPREAPCKGWGDGRGVLVLEPHPEDVDRPSYRFARLIDRQGSLRSTLVKADPAEIHDRRSELALYPSDPRSTPWLGQPLAGCLLYEYDVAKTFARQEPLPGKPP